MKTAIITGVTGQDGSYLTELLLEKGYRVIGLKRRTSRINTERIDHLYSNPNFIMKFWDSSDVGSTYRILNEYQPDEFYNLSAQSHVRVSFDIPEHTVDTVAMGTLRVLEAIRTVNPEIKFYQASSSEMYGDAACPKTGYTEKSPMRPASPYACAKLFSHNLVRNYRESYGIKACSGILFNHESPRRGETFVTRKITIAAAKIKMGLQDKLYLGNTQAMRDWGHAKDYVKAMWMMIQHPESDDYVVSTGQTYSVQHFLETVFEHAGLDYRKHVEQDPRLFRPQEVPYLLGNNKKAKDVLGWKPEYDFKGLAAEMFAQDLRMVREGKL